jgi:hypothetical protein
VALERRENRLAEWAMVLISFFGATYYLGSKIQELGDRISVIEGQHAEMQKQLNTLVAR